MLVIDEIQHLSTSKSGGSKKMLNFFVQLSNTMGLPVLLIGTNKAVHLLSDEFRSARRNCGMVWRPMTNDGEWQVFVTKLWKYQYTKNKVPLSKELADELFDQCQGITDFAVKLYMLAQVRAMVTGIEAVTQTILQSVAKDSLQSAQPYLYALRTGDFAALDNIDDLIHPMDYASLAEKEAKRRQRVEPIPKNAAEKVKEKVAESQIEKGDMKVVSGGVMEAFQTKGSHTVDEAYKNAGIKSPRGEFP